MRLMRHLALTTDPSEVRNEEGVMDKSAAIMEARNMETHMFSDREVMAVCMSLSCELLSGQKI